MVSLLKSSDQIPGVLVADSPILWHPACEVPKVFSHMLKWVGVNQKNHFHLSCSVLLMQTLPACWSSSGSWLTATKTNPRGKVLDVSWICVVSLCRCKNFTSGRREMWKFRWRVWIASQSTHSGCEITSNLNSIDLLLSIACGNAVGSIFSSRTTAIKLFSESVFLCWAPKDNVISVNGFCSELLVGEVHAFMGLTSLRFCVGCQTHSSKACWWSEAFIW